MMKKEFNWETAEYPCLGKCQASGSIICFSDIEVGHNISDVEDCSDSWNMEYFTPYTKPKEKEKLWYWEYFNGIDKWLMCSERFNKNQADKHFTYKHRKLEALGFIVED